MDAALQNTLIFDVLIPVVVLVAARKLAYMAAGYLSTLWVSGKPNEWVLIMRNGAMVNAGVGLCTFKSPFDQVATFPAKVYKVNFSTEQVTEEMQGVQVSGMLVWAVNRIGEGPLNAYKNLGDISSGNPRQANESLIAMASAVVRSCIANSSIQEMLTNRKLLRDAIRKEMFEVVKGWGVWLETVEITDVKICSHALFKDLQTKYREEMRQQSTLYTMKIQQEIEEVRNENTLKVQKKEREVKEKERLYVSAVDLQIKEGHEAYLLARQELLKQKEELSLEKDVYAKQADKELDDKIREIDLAMSLAENDNNIAIEKDGDRLATEKFESRRLTLEQTLEMSQIRKDAQNLIKKESMEFEKANMDAHMLRHKAVQAAEKCYKGRHLSKASITNFDESDVANAALAGILAKVETLKQSQ